MLQVRKREREKKYPWTFQREREIGRNMKPNIFLLAPGGKIGVLKWFSNEKNSVTISGFAL